MPDNPITPKQAATRLGVSDRTLRRWKASGFIGYFRLGGRIFYDSSHIDRLKVWTRRPKGERDD